ncbi:hypothetical protein SBV1_970011 [Verrucomicrobia bacterium]|nr:hypothetical protein SBV1_970011 [Verrucomicrobiota bacterium]
MQAILELGHFGCLSARLPPWHALCLAALLMTRNECARTSLPYQKGRAGFSPAFRVRKIIDFDHIFSLTAVGDQLSFWQAQI